MADRQDRFSAALTLQPYLNPMQPWELAKAFAQSLGNMSQRTKNATEGKFVAPEDMGRTMLDVWNVLSPQAPGARAGMAGDLGTFAGYKGAKNLAAAGQPARLEAMRDAMMMKDAGKTRDEIYQATGWDTNHKDARQWKFEIDDSKAGVTRPPYPGREANPDFAGSIGKATGFDYGAEVPAEAPRMSGAGPKADKRKTASRAGWLDHPELWAAYPELAKGPMKYDADIKATKILGPGRPMGLEEAAYLPPQDLTILGPPGNRGLKPTMLHEFQHGVQAYENWPGQGTYPGGALKEISAALQAKSARGELPQSYTEINDIIREMFDANKASQGDTAFQAYLREAGEAEARNAANRGNMSQEQRMDPALRPWKTSDVPEAKQWTPVNFKNGRKSLVNQDDVGGAQTVNSPLRNTFPGVYGNPKRIAEGARENTAPESPNLKMLWGVTRRDLADMADRQMSPPDWQPKAKAKGSSYMEDVMTPANAQRMIDHVTELKSIAPDMYYGMKGWYPMDPAYQRMVELVGPERAASDFKKFNSMGYYSPNSPVPWEINRGTAANMAWKQGQYDQWKGLGGKPASDRGVWPFVKGHMAHRSMFPMHERYLKSDMSTTAMSDNPKASLYVQSSLPPQLGGQNYLPVPDAHFARDVGVPDVRPTGSKEYLGAPEFTKFGPWYAENVAKPLGLPGTSAQAIPWGGMGHITGVKSKVGATKLEIMSDNIVEMAKKLGITKTPDILDFRDQILMMNKHADLGAGAPVYG